MSPPPRRGAWKPPWAQRNRCKGSAQREARGGRDHPCKGTRHAPRRRRAPLDVAAEAAGFGDALDAEGEGGLAEVGVVLVGEGLGVAVGLAELVGQLGEE